ncbi:hypothetical protein [Prosthecobacter sp.]|uniref:hypothetical protein n=1 Tax=Prosthecobacter sp. TaxID=1965333 RepID=UPI003784CB07
MKASSILLISFAVLAFAWPAVAQTPAPVETIRPAIIPASQTSVKTQSATTAPKAAVPAPEPAKGVVTNPAPVSPPHATLISENSAPQRDLTVIYYRPVGAVSPQSGIRTYPGTTAAHITHGATRTSSGVPAGSTFARLAGSNGSRATRPSTKAVTVGTR